MIMDATLLFSDQQAIIADAASTNVVDLGATGTAYGHAAAIIRDVGNGTPIPLVVTVTQTFTNLTNMVIKVQTDDNAGFSSATDVFVSPTYTLAQLATGAKFLLPNWLPQGTNERYVRLYYDITGSAPDAGKITAGVTMGNQTNTIY